MELSLSEGAGSTSVAPLKGDRRSGYDTSWIPPRLGEVGMSNWEDTRGQTATGCRKSVSRLA